MIAKEGVKVLTDLRRQDGESERQYIWRVATQKEAGLINMSWEELTATFNKELGHDYQAESCYRKPFTAAKQYYDEVFSKMVNGDGQEQRLDNLRRDIQIEREKLRTDRVEVNRWLREYARDDLITERIVDAVKQIEPLPVPELLPERITHEREGVLCFGDEHYGVELEIKGLSGEILNAYSPEIFEARMWDMLRQVLQIVYREGIERLHVFSLGDYIDGIIRASQLMHLRYGIVEGTVLYSNFLATWLNALSEHVRVRFQMTHGNHSELRLIGQPKGSFEKENTGKFVWELLKARLAENANIQFVENPTGLIFETVCGKNILGIHGEVKDLSAALKDFSAVYGQPINILVGGHMHHYSANTAGFDAEVIGVPSIIGVDDYSMRLRRTSNPGALLFIVEEGKGRVVDHHVKLN